MYLPEKPANTKSPKVPYDIGLYNFFRRYLLQKVMSVLKWNFPDFWSQDQIRHFMYTLYINGYIGILETAKYGVVALECSFSGMNLFYAPTKFIVTNPLLSTVERTIGKDGVLLRLQPDVGGYSNNCFTTEWGCMDIVNNYAEQMALATQALDVNIINSQFAYIFTAMDETTAESLKKVYAKVASGDPAVFIDKKLFSDDGSALWQAFQQNLSQNFIAPEIQTVLETINDQFCTMIGLPNANTQKRERMIVDEVNANNQETNCISDIWLETLQEGCKQASDMFGITLSVEKRYKEVGANDDIRKPGLTDNLQQ